MNRNVFLLAIALLTISFTNSDTNNSGLKQQLHKGKKFSEVRVPTNASREQVNEIINEHKPDMLYLDAHHSACTEWDISRICKAAKELNTPVLMRIDHADQAGLISSILDLGVFAIKVPTIEEPETVRKIIDGFYFPPLGKRSLGSSDNYGLEMAKAEDKPYYQWWNENAILGCKLETLRGVLNVRYLALPGVDYFDFGGQDLKHDLLIQQHPRFETIDDCRNFVENALQNKDVFFK